MSRWFRKRRGRFRVFCFPTKEANRGKRLMNGIFKRLLNVKGMVVESSRIVDGPLRPEPVLEVHVRAGKAAPRCSRCGRKRRGYGRGGGVRRWRHRDFGCWRVGPVAMMPRVDCPGCGVVVASVPWAEPGSSRNSCAVCSDARSDGRGRTEALGVPGVPQPHPRNRRTGREDQTPASRRPQDNRAWLSEREARGVRQREQGHRPRGLRLPPRHQPHQPDHAQMRRTRHPTTGTSQLTHENSRSLKNVCSKRV